MPDDGCYLLLIPELECLQQLSVLVNRFLVWPPGLRSAREGTPQDSHEQEQHRRARALVDSEVKLPVELYQPIVIRLACGDLPVEGFDLREVVIGNL